MTVDREKVAKVLFSGVFPDETWEEQSDFIRGFYLKQTDAALASIEAQGLVIVPVEPTEERIEAIARKRFDFVWKNDIHKPDFDEWFRAFKWEVELYYKAITQSQKGGSND